MELKLKNLAMEFGNNIIFKNLSLVFKDSISVVLGSNGSGKTTLLRIIAGLQIPTDGEIISNCKNNIFLCSPDTGLYSDLTISENIKLFSGLMKKNIPDLFDWNLEKFRNIKFGELSSGYKQRAKLMIAFMGEFPVLLLDEPEQHLDEAGISKLTEKIEKRVEQDLITIVATNHLWRKWNVVVTL